MIYIQLDNVNTDLLEQKGIAPAFDADVFTLITDGDDSLIRDIEGTMTLADVLAEANEGDRIIIDNDCPSAIPPHTRTEKGYWSGTTVYVV